jgi:hypothetical protein
MRRQDDGRGCGARGFGRERRPGARAATGLHSQALGPAARSWLTGVAGPRTESVTRTPCNDTAVARREAPAPARAH